MLAESCETRPEVVIGPIYGLRAWELDCFGILHSINIVDTWWPREVKRAHCTRYGCLRNKSPYEFCYCGIYAHKNPERVVCEVEILSETKLSTECAVGVVALWGKIIEHELGWRAEYAYPVWLCRVRLKHGLAGATTADISNLYGIPVGAHEFNFAENSGPRDFTDVTSFLQSALQRVRIVNEKNLD